MRIGTRAKAGIARTTSMLVSMTFSPTRLRPASTASTVPAVMPERQALDDPAEADEQVLLELAVGDQVAGGRQHRAGRRDGVRVEDPERSTPAATRRCTSSGPTRRCTDRGTRRCPAAAIRGRRVSGRRAGAVGAGVATAGVSRRRRCPCSIDGRSSRRQEGLALEGLRRLSVDADRHVADERDAVQDPVAGRRARSRGARGAARRGCPRRRPTRGSHLKRTVYSGRASSANSRSSTWRLSRGDRSTISVVNDGLT